MLEIEIEGVYRVNADEIEFTLIIKLVLITFVYQPKCMLK